jgi:hypothetical protein
VPIWMCSVASSSASVPLHTSTHGQDVFSRFIEGSGAFQAFNKELQASLEDAILEEATGTRGSIR